MTLKMNETFSWSPSAKTPYIIYELLDIVHLTIMFSVFANEQSRFLIIIRTKFTDSKRVLCGTRYILWFYGSFFTRHNTAKTNDSLYSWYAGVGAQGWTEDLATFTSNSQIHLSEKCDRILQKNSNIICASIWHSMDLDGHM